MAKLGGSEDSTLFQKAQAVVCTLTLDATSNGAGLLPVVPGPVVIGDPLKDV